LEAVTALCVAGEKIVTICEKGDKLLEEEISKVYRGKKISKGMCKYHLNCISALWLTLFPRHFTPDHRLTILLRHAIYPSYLG